MNKFKIFILFCIFSMLNSCDAEYEYSSNSCYFVFENSTHQDATLASALNANSPGVFCYINQSTNGLYINFSTNQGLSSSQLENAIDKKRTILLGVNNGIIVGYGNLTGTLYAYDHQCPNCADNTSAYTPNYPLSMNSNGIATCSTCGRKYDMNNGGIIVSGDAGNSLWKYRVSCTGAYGVLIVNN